jgi:DNA repair ATPase RecN
MPDIDARLDQLEERLTTMGDRVDERFVQVDQRFNQVDQRFNQVDQRFEQVDQRFEQVDQRFEQVDQRFGSLESEVQKLRILAERNADQITQIAEVQAHHGDKLQQLVDAVEPLRGLRDFVERVAHDHEHRITALEGASRQRTPET